MRNRGIGALICTVAMLSAALAQNNTQSYIKNPKLESVLSQLINASNPQDFVRTHNLYIKDGNIRVVVELTNESALLPDYAAEETRYRNKVQILVPVEKIEALSHETNVTFIRAPLKPYADTPTNIPTATAIRTPFPKSGFKATIPIVLSMAVILLIRKKRSGRNVKK